VLGCSLLLCGCPNSGSVEIAFQASISPGVTGYYVYRDGLKVSPLVPTTSYVDQQVPAGAHAYYVTSFNGVESAPSNTANVVVP
jgi:hypothetical protein